MEYIIVALFFVSLAAIICFELRWRSVMKLTVVTEEIVLKKKKLRNVEIILAIVCVVMALYSYEIITGREISSVTSFLLIGLVLGLNRTVFEPYYTTEIIDKLDDYAIYLRSFDLDRQTIIQNKRGFTHGAFYLPEKLEKTLCGTVEDSIGMVYAIGDPGSVAPNTLVAASIYADDANWKSAVEKLSEKAKLILLRLGNTDGCRWELIHCLNKNYTSKIIFIVDDIDDLKLIDQEVNIPLPAEVYDMDFSKCSYGLYLAQSGQWKYKSLPTEKAVRQLIEAYLEDYPAVQKSKITFGTIRQAKSKSKWWDFFSLLMNPLAYSLYNRWAKPMLFMLLAYVMVVSCAVVMLLLDLSEDEDSFYALFVILGLPFYVLSTLPWLWFAPKYTTAVNSWGGVEADALANKNLSKCLMFYSALAMIVAIMLY